MSRCATILLAFALSLHLALPASAQALKLATMAPEGSPWYDLLVDLAQSWKTASSGATTLHIYPGGVAGDEGDVIRKMRIGQIQLAALSGHGLSEITPEIQALQMPMMFRSDRELDCVRDHLAARIEALTETHGFKILNWSDAGWVRFFTQTPVVRPDEMKSLKIFTWEGDPTYLEAMKAMGYRPVALAATDIYTGLESGMINAVPTTPILALSYQWFGLAKNMTDVRWAPLLGATVITLKAWQSIPDNLKPAFESAARSIADGSRARIRSLDDKAIAAMQSHGLVVHPVPQELLGEWEAVAQEGYTKVVGKVVPAEALGEVERVRDACRSAQP